MHVCASAYVDVHLLGPEYLPVDIALRLGVGETSSCRGQVSRDFISVMVMMVVVVVVMVIAMAIVMVVMAMAEH